MIKKVKMKYLIVIISLFAFVNTSTLSAQADAIDKYFQQYVEDERFSVVYISPKMFQMIAKIAEDEEDELREAISDLQGLRILTTEHNTQGFYEEALRKINTKEYEVLMTVRSEGDNVRFLVKESGDIINELLMLVGGDEDFALMSFVGNIDLDKLAKLSDSVDIDGLDHLDELDKN